MMKKKRCTGLVCCFNSQWNGGASTVTRKVGVTSDVLLALLAAFLSSKHASTSQSMALELDLHQQRQTKTCGQQSTSLGGPNRHSQTLICPTEPKQMLQCHFSRANWSKSSKGQIEMHRGSSTRVRWSTNCCMGLR
jgi:hypothetical protein